MIIIMTNSGSLACLSLTLIGLIYEAYVDHRNSEETGYPLIDSQN